MTIRGLCCSWETGKVMAQLEKSNITWRSDIRSAPGTAYFRLVIWLLCCAALSEKFVAAGQSSEPEFFQWTVAPASAQVGVPFVVSIQTVDADGTATTNFND